MSLPRPPPLLELWRMPKRQHRRQAPKSESVPWPILWRLGLPCLLMPVAVQGTMVKDSLTPPSGSGLTFCCHSTASLSFFCRAISNWLIRAVSSAISEACRRRQSGPAMSVKALAFPHTPSTKIWGYPASASPGQVLNSCSSSPLQNQSCLSSTYYVPGTGLNTGRNPRRTRIAKKLKG